MKTSEYEIGGVCVYMTKAQAKRWNTGDITDRDLNTVRVFIPKPQNSYREISLRRATNQRLEPVCASLMEDTPAVFVREHLNA